GGVVQRLKVMARMDLTQTRRPQDGKFRFTHHGETYDVRMSTLPTVAGENVVLRILPRNASIAGFEALGMSAEHIEQMERLIASPHGIVLVTGPTGSGKTTTLYTALSRLNTPDRNIMTIEDPVEIRLPLVRQTQVNTEIGMTFAGALRSILRQDPDVVLVGEIRDSETAQIAVQASLTGHLVFSTLHTNDALGAVARLVDLGVPRFAVNGALLGALAQRLVRRVCEHCRIEDAPDEATMRFWGLEPHEAGGFSRGRGCGACLDTGYRGRVGVYELLIMTPGLRDAIDAGATPQQLQRAAIESGLKPMWQDGLEKARLGLTSLEELTRLRAAIDESTHVYEDRRVAA
ncbi:MAG: GspE/PulE family protein, partial [Planctomycetota bacterium]|nr:GspE/PulE family protein [Planctomycetota bacterium]